MNLCLVESVLCVFVNENCNNTCRKYDYHEVHYNDMMRKQYRMYFTVNLENNHLSGYIYIYIYNYLNFQRDLEQPLMPDQRGQGRQYKMFLQVAYQQVKKLSLLRVSFFNSAG